jgi:nucleoside-diphosphate-sugar epimerase
MRVLIIGGKGFIGKRLSEIIRHKHEVYVADVRLTRSVEESVQSEYFLDVTDISQTRELISNLSPAVIFHMAGKVDFRWSLQEPVKDLLLHTLGTLNVLEAARNLNPSPHMIYASSSAIFGNAKTIPTPEDCPPSPTTPYGINKWAGEQYCCMYSQLYDVPTTIIRFTNVYGPNTDHGVIHTLLKKFCQKQPITLFGGWQKIQFLYADDAVTALKLAAEKQVTGIFNIGGPDTVTLKELVQLIAKEIGYQVPMMVQPPLKGDIMHTEFDTSKAKRELGWEPKFSTPKGLKQCIKWYRSNT